MPDSGISAAESKAAFDSIATAFEEFKVVNDQRLREMATRGAADPLTSGKVERLNAELTRLQDGMARIETAIRRPASQADSRPLDPLAIEHKQAFMTYVRKGNDAGLGELERKALTIGADPEGGFLVPSDMMGRIVTRLFETSPVRSVAAVETISTDALEGLRDTDEAGAGWVSETGARVETTTPQLGRWRIAVSEMYAEPRATQQLLDDAAVDAEAWLEAKIADKFARLEANAFVLGDGNGKPRGFTTYPTEATADATRDWGKVEHVVTGVNGAFPATNPADLLVTLVYKMKAGYRSGAVWMLPKAVVQEIRKFKEATTNAYIWQPGLQWGQPPSLLGYPIVEAEDMPAMATGSLSIAFGNFGIAYQIVDRQGVRVLRDPFTAKPYVKFYTTRRVGGDVVQFEALKFIKFST